MSSILSGIGGMAERSASEAVAFGLGLALGAALEPEGNALAQEVWAQFPSKALDAAAAAAIVAEEPDQHAWGAGEAAAHGVNGERFARLVDEALNAPEFGALVRMIRRGTISQADLEHGLRKAHFEARWDEPLAELAHERLDPAVIATSIQRGIIEDPGLLPVPPPSEVGRVPPMPVARIDALQEAAAGGYDRERLAAITRIVGLPPAPGELLQLLNRGEIIEADFYRGIAEGNTRNEWAPFLLKLRQRLLTPHEYAELRVRGWIDTPAMIEGTALHGMSADDTELLFNLLGRPIPIHQVTTGLARGGEFEGDFSHVPDAYIRSLQEGNLRPEWYSLAYANRYNYPGAFVLRSLTQAGDLSETEARDILLFEGWEPTLAAKVAERWSQPAGAKADTHVGKAQTQLWGTLHKAFVIEQIGEAGARAELEAIGVRGDAQDAVLELWTRERDIDRLALTPAQIKKAVGGDDLTVEAARALLKMRGVASAEADALDLSAARSRLISMGWTPPGPPLLTRAEALERLGRLGMNADDAATLLDE